MIETTQIKGARALTAHAGQNERAVEREQQSNAEYYRNYYRLLVEEHANRCEGRRGLEVIKRQRRRARREKLWQGMRSLTGVSGGAASNL